MDTPIKWSEPSNYMSIIDNDRLENWSSNQKVKKKVWTMDEKSSVKRLKKTLKINKVIIKD